MPKKNEITLQIDGRTVSVPPGTSILNAARDSGTDIPTLCYHPRLPANGSCLLCVVEMTVDGTTRMVLSCTIEAREGMCVETGSEAALQARRNALDLLLSNHFADCRGACYGKCPAGVDVQGYLALANAGKYREALELIRENNPLPLVCGRVCVHYCEGACRRSEVDEPVAINFIKRYVADLENDRLPSPVVAPKNGHQVAVVGGGPAGLTAAYYLARQGTRVVIFDAHPRLGGMLRYGIPDYRLPQEMLDKEIEYILAHGVEVRTNCRLGRDFSLDELKQQGFDAFFLALGAQTAKKMRVEAEESAGVIGGIHFLEQVKMEGPADLRGHVLVVGGGNTAIDAARTALRCHAMKVTILYRRTREEMPAADAEIEDALAEGVNIEYLTAPLAVVTEGGQVKALRCQRMQLGEPDASGRRRPVPIDNSEHDVVCSTVIAAIGQDCDLDCLKEDRLGDVERTTWKTIKTDPQTMATSVPGVFAGGDAATGPAAAVDAIAAGRRAASAIELYLLDGSIRSAPPEFLSRKTAVDALPDDFFDGVPQGKRPSLLQEDPTTRIEHFREVDHGIAAEDVGPETSRCLSCGCADVFTCKLKRYAGEYGASQRRFPGRTRKYKPDRRHPFIALDQNKCVLCGSCVRTCDSLLGVGALGFIHRGFDMKVRPSMERALQETDCISCGNCIEACPTGAISFNLNLANPGPWPAVTHRSVCSFCGGGCGLEFNRMGVQAWTVTAVPESSYVNGQLCARGRFGHHYLVDPARIRAARVRNGDGSKDTNLDYALEQAISGLRDAARTHGADALAFLVSPKTTNEEVFLVRKIAVALGTSNFGSLYDLGHDGEESGLEDALGWKASTLPRHQVEEADLIVLVNSNVTEEHPTLGFSVRRAAGQGADVVAVSSTELGISDMASLWLDARRGTAAVLLSAVAEEIIRTDGVDREFIARRTEGFDSLVGGLPSPEQAEEVTGVHRRHITKLARMLADPARNAVFIYNAGSMLEKSPGDLQAIANLLLLTGRFGRPRNGLILTREHSNCQGLGDLGTTPIGRVALRENLLSGRVRGMFLLGENLVVNKQYADFMKRSDFNVVMDLVESESSRLAQVVLPASAPAESDGCLTSFDRKVQAFTRAFEPPAGVTGFEVLSRMQAKLTGDPPLLLSEVRDMIADSNPLYRGLASVYASGSFYAGEWGNGKRMLFAERFLTPNGRGVLASPPVQPRVYTPQAWRFAAIDRHFEDRRRALLVV
jgi:formate dehydrogenase major subunit